MENNERCITVRTRDVLPTGLERSAGPSMAGGRHCRNTNMGECFCFEGVLLGPENITPCVLLVFRCFYCCILRVALRRPWVF